MWASRCLRGLEPEVWTSDIVFKHYGTDADTSVRVDASLHPSVRRNTSMVVWRPWLWSPDSKFGILVEEWVVCVGPSPSSLLFRNSSISFHNNHFSGCEKLGGDWRNGCWLVISSFNFVLLRTLKSRHRCGSCAYSCLIEQIFHIPVWLYSGYYRWISD
jgi:hypothetical protein